MHTFSLRYLRLPLAVTLLTACAACATSSSLASNSAAERSLKYTDYALAPVERFNAFTLHSWLAVSDHELVVWTTFREAYLLTVWPMCMELPFAQRIAIRRSMGSVTKFDQVLVGRDRCPIERIQPLDLKRMDADRAAMRATPPK